MKKIVAVVYVLFAGQGIAQVNLVTNPGFELFSSCPNNWYQIGLATGWEAWKGSPDYYNSCGATDSFDVPQNLIGNQAAASGNAYCGVILYDKSNNGNDEMIATGLSQSLSVGIKYFVSFKVVWKYNNPYAICCSQDKIGVRFSTAQYSQMNPPAQNNTAHIYSNSIVSDTSDWTTIFGSFIADSTYSFLVLGNFFDSANVAINDQFPANNSSYYFLDDVCVSTDSLLAADFSTGISLNIDAKEFEVWPNPASQSCYISTPNNSNQFDIRIYNSVGELVFIEENRWEHTLELQGIDKGLLLIEITSDNQTFLYKLLHL